MTCSYKAFGIVSSFGFYMVGVYLHNIHNNQLKIVKKLETMEQSFQNIDKHFQIMEQFLN